MDAHDARNQPESRPNGADHVDNPAQDDIQPAAIDPNLAATSVSHASSLDASEAKPPLDDATASASSPDSDAGRDPFEEIASEFSDRQRNGEFPSIEEYVRRYPDLEEEIRELFPTIAAMEQLKGRKAPAPRPARGSLPVEQLGDFRILGEIGRGGMGVVYEAEQVSLGRHVAVKVLPKQALLDERHLRRFEREAQTAAKLHHTNIVPVFGVGQQDGYHYIVMQFIAGVGLDEILVALRSQVLNDTALEQHLDNSSRADHATQNARALLDGDFSKQSTGKLVSTLTQPASSGSFSRPLDATEALRTTELSSSNAARSGSANSGFATNGSGAATNGAPLDADYSVSLGQLGTEYFHSIARIGQQVSDALAYAHEQGTLHRDIKPGNLLLDGTGTVWVADFGLAKLAEHDNVSRTGDIVGTLSYMPPESFSGDVDARGDIYALGLTLYELLAMRPAYFGRDRGKLVRQITAGELPRLSKLNPAVPRDLETIVLKAIAHRPEDRYETARDLETDLQLYLSDSPILARRMSLPEQFTRWCRKNKLVASLSATVFALLLVLTATFAYLHWQTGQQRDLAVARKNEAEDAKTEAESAKTEAEKQREIAETQRENARQTAKLAISGFSAMFDGLWPERLPLSADQSVQNITQADNESELPTDEQLNSPEEEAATSEEDEAVAAAATVATPPVTEELGTQLKVVLKAIEPLVEAAGNDPEFTLVFADLTLRAGKLYRLLGNREEANAHYKRSIEQYEAMLLTPESKLAATVGLALAYNESAEVAEGFQARGYYDRALKLLDNNDAVLQQSSRAKYELARTLFLISVHRFRFDKRDSPWRRAREEAGRTEQNLRRAIELLQPLVETEANPEFRYLQARCYSGLSIVRRRRPPHESDMFDDFLKEHEYNQHARKLLKELVEQYPHVDDYRFEYGVAQLMRMKLVPPGTQQIKAGRNAVALLDRVADKNPNVANYSITRAYGRLKYLEALHRNATDAQLRQRGRVHQETVETTRILVEAYRRSPQQLAHTLHSLRDNLGQYVSWLHDHGLQQRVEEIRPLLIEAMQIEAGTLNVWYGFVRNQEDFEIGLRRLADVEEHLSDATTARQLIGQLTDQRVEAIRAKEDLVAPELAILELDANHAFLLDHLGFELAAMAMADQTSHDLNAWLAEFRSTLQQGQPQKHIGTMVSAVWLGRRLASFRGDTASPKIEAVRVELLQRAPEKLRMLIEGRPQRIFRGGARP